MIDNRDAALFNAAQQTTAACQSDFMAVGGGMALDQPVGPHPGEMRAGTDQGYVVSNASDLAADQVDPSGINTDSVSSGWFGALAKAYPKAVKVAGMGRRHPLGPPARNQVRVRRRGAGLEGRRLPRAPDFGRELGTLCRAIPAEGGRRCGPPTLPTSPPSPRR